jgi:hypothetical protein
MAAFGLAGSLAVAARMKKPAVCRAMKPLSLWIAEGEGIHAEG